VVALAKVIELAEKHPNPKLDKKKEKIKHILISDLNFGVILD
jgi:hypothetical protein